MIIVSILIFIIAYILGIFTHSYFAIVKRKDWTDEIVEPIKKKITEKKDKKKFKVYSPTKIKELKDFEEELNNE